MRRVLAWVLLIGFVALVVNLMVIHFETEISVALYVAAVVYFLYLNTRHKIK